MATRYFIAKVDNFKSLLTCVQTERWACKDRVQEPQTRHVLTEAFSSSKVVLIYSVSGSHGWHGWAQMMSPPGDGSEVKSVTDRTLEVCTSSKNVPIMKENDLVVEDGSESEKILDWHYFKVKWNVSYIEDFGEQGLPFKSTESESFVSVDDTPVNKCRNWQEIGPQVGAEMCNLMDNHLVELHAKRDKKLQKQAERQAPAFYTETSHGTFAAMWEQLIQKVEATLGTVILACPFGSQRYNLSTPESDVDMFIVYQAKTSQILGFNPPKQTIKSSEHEELDYSIMEVYRFCELLITGDARCVETLFLDESTVVHASTVWQHLVAGRHLFLHKGCLNKYLRDAQGAKGTRYLEKWCNDNKVDVLPPKLCKMLYVIVRLLQNARDISAGGLTVYRQDDSDDRQQLMKIRSNNVPVDAAWEIIHSLEASIQAKIHEVPEKTDAVDVFVEKWLLQQRYHSFMEESVK